MASNNQVLLDEVIKNRFAEEAHYDGVDKFFEFFASQQVLRSYDLSDEEVEENLTGNGNDGGCDGIFFFLNGELYHEDMPVDQVQQDAKLTLVIIQSKNETSFGESTFDKWKATTNNLLRLDADYEQYRRRYDTKVIRAFSMFRDTYVALIHKRIRLSIEYKYVSKGIEIHPNVRAQADELKALARSLFPNPTVSIDISFIGADRLMELIETPEYSEFYLKLAETPINIGEQQVYVTLVSLVDYYRFITNSDHELIKQIFESNIRDYQGKVTVNREIRGTLENSTSEDFWWLNNGVTIVAESAIFNTSKELKITYPEIVNGLQTSNEIFGYFSSHPEAIGSEKRHILVRVIVPKSEDSRDKIIFATNSQTAIPKASLRATDGIHRQIELYFRPRNLFYDRRKNYYKNQGIKVNQIVSVPFLAQCLMSILLRKPDYARARPSTLLMDDDAYNELYDVQKISLTAFYVAAYIGKKASAYIKSCGKYAANEKTDILFYTVYLTAARIVEKMEISSKDLERIDITKVDDNLISTCADFIYSIYVELGGNDTVAKGSEMIQEVLKKAETLLIK